MKEENELLRALAMVVLIGASFCLITAYQWSWEEHAVAAGPGWPPATKEELRAAMQYHGTPWAEKDEDGVWWFARGGQRCRLFNDQFEAAHAKKHVSKDM